jgi:hypothetical protein
VVMQGLGGLGRGRSGRILLGAVGERGGHAPVSKHSGQPIQCINPLLPALRRRMPIDQGTIPSNPPLSRMPFSSLHGALFQQLPFFLSAIPDPLRGFRVLFARESRRTGPSAAAPLGSFPERFVNPVFLRSRGALHFVMGASLLTAELCDPRAGAIQRSDPAYHRQKPHRTPLRRNSARPTETTARIKTRALPPQSRSGLPDSRPMPFCLTILSSARTAVKSRPHTSKGFPTKNENESRCMCEQFSMQHKRVNFCYCIVRHSSSSRCMCEQFFKQRLLRYHSKGNDPSIAVGYEKGSKVTNPTSIAQNMRLVRNRQTCTDIRSHFLEIVHAIDHVPSRLLTKLFIPDIHGYHQRSMD